MRSRILFAIFAFCLCLGTSRAHAQDASLDEARAAFDAGQDAFVDGKYLEAAKHFEEAYAARPFAQFLFNIGACYEKAKDYPKALLYYNKYLSEKPPEDDAKKTKERVAALKIAVKEITSSGGDPSKAEGAKEGEAVEKLEKVEIRGLVVIESDPQGAEIYLDSVKGKPLSLTPWNGTFKGEHKVILTKPGYKKVERTIKPDPEKLFLFVASLGEEDYLGFLDVTSNVPGASIYIDDKKVGAKALTPWSGQVEPGEHKVWITKEGYNEYETTIEVLPGKTYKVQAALEGSEVGYLNVRGKGVEKVKIYVDGDVLCERGPCRKPLLPGEHKVSVRRSGYKPYNQTIEVQGKTEVTMRALLAPEPSRTDAIVAYVFAAAFIGGGYYLGTKAQDIEVDLAKEIEAGNPPPDSNDPRLGWSLESGKTYATAANVAYGLGGATFALALYYTFRDKGKPSVGTSEIQVAVEPTLGPDYQGIGLAGSF